MNLINIDDQITKTTNQLWRGIRPQFEEKFGYRLGWEFYDTSSIQGAWAVRSTTAEQLRMLDIEL